MPATRGKDRQKRLLPMAPLMGLSMAVAVLTGCASLAEGIGALLSRPDAPEAVRREPGQDVLDAGHRIAFEEKRVFAGSCWDFVDAVYEAAGYPGSRRSAVFQSNEHGPYADPDLIRPGDWVMHLNLEYGEVTHSSIFVRWSDAANHIAQTLGYVGMKRNATGKYAQHRYTKVYAILRPVKVP